MPLSRPGLPPVYQPGEKRTIAAPAPNTPKPFLSPEMAKAAAEARHAQSQPVAPVPVANPTPQSDPDQPPGNPPRVLPVPGMDPVMGEPLQANGAQALPPGSAPPPAPVLGGIPAAGDGTSAASQQQTILSQDEQNMAGSLDDAELLHLEEMVRLAKSQRSAQNPPATVVPGTGEKAPQVNSQGEAPHAINERPDHDDPLMK